MTTIPVIDRFSLPMKGIDLGEWESRRKLVKLEREKPLKEGEEECSYVCGPKEVEETAIKE